MILIDQQLIDSSYIRKLIEKGDWKEVLLDTIKRNGIDPLNIDIQRLTEEYIRIIEIAKEIDLRIPANIILAAAILLKIKSESFIERFSYREDYQESNNNSYDIVSSSQIEFDQILIVPKGTRKRALTLEELLQQIDESIKLNIESSKNYEAIENIASDIVIEPYDIDARMTALLDIISKTIDSYKMTTFSSLIRYFDNVIEELFIPMIFLANESKISLKQDEDFGEIFIIMKDDA
ncbi:MAG: segregation and condensation protein A [Candidatus Micrarchaeota archaeon]|nr:MAG: segregation and condensation protein A [Candidatus Micrarchaeota archaeon]